MCIYCRKDVKGSVMPLNSIRLGEHDIHAYIDGDSLELAMIDVPDNYEEYFDNTSSLIKYCPMCGRRLEGE